jgi:dCMP deaminase
MQAAHIYARLSYCKRRKVGCVIVKDDRIISIGFNGTPPGWSNDCEDENHNTLPEVYHAETNAIAKLAKSAESGMGAAMFVTTVPCIECAKLIAQSGIHVVYYSEDYRKTDGLDFLRRCGITVEYLDPAEWKASESDSPCA